MSTEAATARCSTCQGSGFVTADRDCIAKPVIEAKDGSRAAWVGLLARTRFTFCPDCEKPKPKPASVKRRYGGRSK